MNRNSAIAFSMLGLSVLFFGLAVGGCAAGDARQPPPDGWTRIEWNPNRDCGYWLPFQPAYVQPDITYTLDIPKDYHLKQGEGSSFIWSGDWKKPAVIHLNYWGDKPYRQKSGWAHTKFPNPHGFNWLDARKELDYRISVIKKEADDQAKGARTWVKIRTIHLDPSGQQIGPDEESFREFASQDPELEMSNLKKDKEASNKRKIIFTYLDEHLKPTPALKIAHPWADCLLQCKPITTQIIDGISFCRADLEIPPRCPCMISAGYNHHAVLMLSDNGTDLLFDGANPFAEQIVASFHKK